MKDSHITFNYVFVNKMPWNKYLIIFNEHALLLLPGIMILL